MAGCHWLDDWTAAAAGLADWRAALAPAAIAVRARTATCVAEVPTRRYYYSCMHDLRVDGTTCVVPTSRYMLLQ